jgi:alpha-galactosidase
MCRTQKFCILAVFVASYFITAQAYFNGFGQRPSMGWDTWCSGVPCGADVCSDENIRQVATAMIDNGMRAAGYNWIGIDDCWADDQRASDGTLQANPLRFPHGIKALTTFLRSIGFHFGIYTSAGSSTCEHSGFKRDIPGSFGHYAIDAQTFADWGVDMVKVDWCGKNLTHPHAQHLEFSQALNATGRAMLYQICRGYDGPDCDSIVQSPWVPGLSQEARATNDHHDSWKNSAQTINNLAKAVSAGNSWTPRVGSASSFWLFGDFLYTGGQGCSNNASAHCPGQTDDEYQTTFSIWSIVSSPLYVSSDVRFMTQTMAKIILNTEVIAIDQDFASVIGERTVQNATGCTNGKCDIWSRNLSDGSVAVLFVNMGDQESGNQSFSLSLELLFPAANESTQVIIRDLWTHEDMPPVTIKGNTASALRVASHACVFFRIRIFQPWFGPQ